MMRTVLAFAALVTSLWFMSGVSKAQPQRQVVGKPQEPVGWPREVKGYGTTIEQAQPSTSRRVRDCFRPKEFITRHP